MQLSAHDFLTHVCKQLCLALQEAHKSLILVKGQSKQCGKELVDNIKYSEEVTLAYSH